MYTKTYLLKIEGTAPKAKRKLRKLSYKDKSYLKTGLYFVSTHKNRSIENIFDELKSTGESFSLFGTPFDFDNQVAVHI